MADNEAASRVTDKPASDISGIEAVSMLSIRLLMDMLSLRIDQGELTVDEAKKLLDFSAGEVVRGSPHLADQMADILAALKEKFDQTDYSSRSDE